MRPEDFAGWMSACGPLCRIVMAVRLHRIFCRRLIGLSLLVLEPNPA